MNGLRDVLRSAGVALAAEVSRANPATRVLMMSGYGESVLTQQGIVLAGVNHIEKPFSPAALLDRLRSLPPPHYTEN